MIYEKKFRSLIFKDLAKRNGYRMSVVTQQELISFLYVHNHAVYQQIFEPSHEQLEKGYRICQILAR